MSLCSRHSLCPQNLSGISQIASQKREEGKAAILIAGMCNLGFGIWNLEFGIWDLQRSS
jgi:hypothetical protein